MSKYESFWCSGFQWMSLWRSDKFLLTLSLLGKIILNKHISKTKVYFNQRGDKCDEIARGQFSKITETACLSGWEFETDNNPYGVYATRHWNWMNSYWMFWIGRLRGVIFKKLPFVIWQHVLLFDAKKSCVFQIFLLRSIKAYLCPNSINFDDVDFSEHRPEEVISFFWCSVYERWLLPAHTQHYMSALLVTYRQSNLFSFLWSDLMECTRKMYVENRTFDLWVSFIYLYSILYLMTFNWNV